MIVLKNKIIFCTGSLARDLTNLINMDEVFCFLDNDKSKQGKEFEGLKIYSLEGLMEKINIREYKIFIASISHYVEISHQLSTLGLVEGIHYFDVLPLMPVEEVRKF